MSDVVIGTMINVAMFAIAFITIFIKMKNNREANIKEKIQVVKDQVQLCAKHDGQLKTLELNAEQRTVDIHEIKETVNRIDDKITRHIEKG